MAIEYPSCPLCKSENHRKAYSKFTPYKVVRCRSCGFYYLYPRLTETAILNLYADDDYFEGEERGYTSYSEQEVALRATFKLVKLAITGITAFSSLPLHLITFFGCLFLIFAAILGSQAFFLKLTGRAVDGFTTVILLLLIIGSLLMISLGIIGLYIARIYEEVKGRPRYIISEIIDAK